MSQLCGFDGCLYACPCHDGRGFRIRIAFQNLIPCQHFLASFGNFLFHFVHEVHLKLVLLAVFFSVVQSQFLNLGLTFRTFHPFRFRAFISSDVNIRCIREYIHQFVYHVFGKLQCLRVSSAKHFLENTEFCSRFIRTACTSQFRIRSQCCQHMSRHVYFRNDRNETFCRVCYNFFGVFLCVVTTDRCTVEFPGPRRSNCFLTVRADFSQFWIFLDFNTPALVFGQMPVEVVDVVQCHDIYQLL